MNNLRIGFAMCGSFCTYSAVLKALKGLRDRYENIYPIMSETSYSTDSRFGSSKDFIKEIEEICGRKILSSITGTEPIGPKKLLDLLVIMPCTGNTIAKLACGIADSAVTLACKAHLRNSRPVVIGVSSNDALAANAANIGLLLNRKNIYFIPFRQDDPIGKPTSLVADFTKAADTIAEAIEGRQIQPLLVK